MNKVIGGNLQKWDLSDLKQKHLKAFLKSVLIFLICTVAAANQRYITYTLTTSQNSNPFFSIPLPNVGLGTKLGGKRDGKPTRYSNCCFWQEVEQKLLTEARKKPFTSSQEQPAQSSDILQPCERADRLLYTLNQLCGYF